MSYTPEQEKDIKERVEKAQKYLKELNLYPAAIVQKVNKGDDEFVDKVICYLQDSRYQSIKSPLQKKDL